MLWKTPAEELGDVRNKGRFPMLFQISGLFASKLLERAKKESYTEDCI
jgi:hypothetical protein